jgi:hypothetical protein
MVATHFRPRQRAAPHFGDAAVARSVLINRWRSVSLTKEDRAMTYRVYSGPRGSQSIAPAEKDRHLYKEFSGLDEAMSWARHLNGGGRVALLIEGDDGTQLTKQQVATALKHSESGEAGEDAA